MQGDIDMAKADLIADLKFIFKKHKIKLVGMPDYNNEEELMETLYYIEGDGIHILIEDLVEALDET